MLAPKQNTSGIEQKEPVKRKLNWKMSSSRGSQTLRLVYLCPTIIPQPIPFVPFLSKMRLILESNWSLDQRSPRNTEKGAPTTTSTHQYMATTAKERRRTNKKKLTKTNRKQRQNTKREKQNQQQQISNNKKRTTPPSPTTSLTVNTKSAKTTKEKN